MKYVHEGCTVVLYKCTIEQGTVVLNQLTLGTYGHLLCKIGWTLSRKSLGKCLKASHLVLPVVKTIHLNIQKFEKLINKLLNAPNHPKTIQTWRKLLETVETVILLLCQ